MHIVQAHYLPDNYETAIEWIQRAPSIAAGDAVSAHDWLAGRLSNLLDEVLARGGNPLDGRAYFPANGLACIVTAIAQPFGPHMELELRQSPGAKVLEVEFYGYL